MLVTELVRSFDDTEKRPLRVGAPVPTDPVSELEEEELFIEAKTRRGGRDEGYEVF